MTFTQNHKDIDFNNKKSMINFLTNHTRYWTMNSWNRSSSYANNVKIYNLDIPNEHIDTAYALISGEIESYEYQFTISDLIDDFTEKTGYTVGFNGRSNGYLVLYNTQINNNKRQILIGQSLGSSCEYDYENYDLDELREETELVIEFDKLCDNIKDTLLYYISNSKIETQEYTITKTKKVLIPNDAERI